MSNPLYYQWLDAVAQRDNAMLFIVVTALATIGAWLAWRELHGDRRLFVALAVVMYYASLALVWIQVK